MICLGPEIDALYIECSLKWDITIYLKIYMSLLNVCLLFVCLVYRWDHSHGWLNSGGKTYIQRYEKTQVPKEWVSFLTGQI